MKSLCEKPVFARPALLPALKARRGAPIQLGTYGQEGVKGHISGIFWPHAYSKPRDVDI